MPAGQLTRRPQPGHLPRAIACSACATVVGLTALVLTAVGGFGPAAAAVAAPAGTQLHAVPVSSAPPAGAVTIPVGENAEQIVRRSPAGTSFVITAGLHIRFTVTALANDRFYAQPGAVLDGMHLVQCAFRVPYGGTANGVQVIGAAGNKPLIVENYGKSSHSQIGAIQASSQTPTGTIYSSGWLLQWVEVTGDASRGVTVSDGMVLLGCQIISNGRLGVGGGGNGITITGSTISDNGLIVADRGWEAGGIKTVADNVLIDDNRIEGNGAPGIWTDVDATDVVVADNHLSSNTYGLEIEISRDVTIMANSITATRKQAVLVVASKGVSVVGNTLTDNFGGVLIGGATRIGPSGVRLGNVQVNHNLIANSGVTGLHQTPIPGTVVHFDRDTYRGGRFQWDGRQVTFAQFRMFGQEAHGAFSQ